MKKDNKPNLSRRNFMKSTTKGAIAASLAITGFPTIVPASVFGKNAPSNKINIGQIGFGRIAKGHDLPDVMRNDIARVVAVSDVDSKRMDLDRLLDLQKEVIKIKRGTAPCPKPYFMRIAHGIVMGESCLDQTSIGFWYVSPIIAHAGTVNGPMDHIGEIFLLFLQQGNIAKGAIGAGERDYTIIGHRFYQVLKFVIVRGHIFIVSGVFRELDKEHTLNVVFFM